MKQNTTVQSFRVFKRNFGHWDIIMNDHGRIFRIRGGGHCSWDTKNFSIIGEGEFKDATPKGWLEFKTLTAAMSWITDYLMHEDKVWPEGIQE